LASEKGLPKRATLPAGTAALVAVSLLIVGGSIPSPTRPAVPSGGAQPQPATAAATERPDGWFADLKSGLAKPKLPEQVKIAFVIPVREPITTKTFEAIKRKALRCHQAKAELVIFDLDTWGGQLAPALDIARLLKADLNDVRTVCYVRTRGISAGALIALACDEIVMTPTGKLGDCAPIVAMAKLEGTEREKIESSLRTEFVESAERNGYPVALAESMVTIGREVWLVRNRQTRELRYVLRKDFAGKVAVPPGLSTAPSNPKGQWEVLKVVVTNKELLTMTPTQAKEYGFVSDLIEAPRDNELAGVLKRFNVVGRPTVLTDTWSERLVGFLSSAPVVTFLFFVAILCGYIEMHTPGFGVAGGLAIACLAVVFGSGFLVGLAAWWEIALFAVGLVLLAIEIFITPGFGVLGISGGICCLVAIVAMLIPNAPDKWPIPQTDVDWSIFTDGLMALMVGFLMALAGAALLGRFLPKVPIASRLVLQPPQRAGTGPATEEAPIHKVQPGTIGTVEHPCRPVGQVRFGEALVDAIADGQFIQAGVKVKAVKIEGNRVVVTEVA